MAALRFVRSDRSRKEPHTATEGVVNQNDIDKVGVTKDELVQVVKAGDAVSNSEASGGDDGTRSRDDVLTGEGETTARDKGQPEEGAVTPSRKDETTEGGTTAFKEARATEGDVTPLDVGRTEEGDEGAKSATSREMSGWGSGHLSEEPAAEQPSAIDSLAKVRAVAKQARREAKRQRVERAVRRSNRGVAEVERAVTALSDEQRLRRRQQAKVARMELAQRQQATRKTSVDRASAKVSLVQSTFDSAATKELQVKGIAADDGLPTATMTVDAERVAIKLDSGARYSVAGTDWMQRGERLRKDAPVDCVEGIGGFLLNVLGVWAFTMRNAYGQLVEMEACIVEGCTDEFLVGVDFLRRHRATMDFECNEVKYFEHDKLVIIPFRTEGEEGGAKVAAVRLVKQSRLVRSAVTPVEVMVTAPDGEEGIFVPTQRCGTVMMAATVTAAKGGKAWIPVINVHGGKTKLPAKKELGTWVPVDADMQLLKMNDELKTDKVEEWLAMLGDCETPLDNEDEVRLGTEDPNSQRLVLKLLRAYRKVSKEAGDCPPVTALDVEHHIDTGSEKPIMLKRRRHAQSEDAIMEDNVSKMLRAGVIEEGNGAWGFPVVLVRKKDGEVRFCVDYRALNKVTKRDVYPLPRIDETLEALGGARLFTTLDLKAGYWQISVASEDRDKTAFTTKQGLYRFVRMPFGLMNAPSTFQRMMNGVLRGLTWSTCLVYLDDIVVYTRGGIERHVVELATVLERLSAAGLTLKLKKCVFAATSMEYLGHELSSEGVRPVERLVTAVRGFPRPSDPVEVKRFVHLAGYYRKFIAAFGSIMAPLTRLLKKSSEWEWTEEQEFAFERVKAALTTRPLLIYPNFGLPFRLVTDASKTGLGACLMQDQGRGWQPVAFASKVNSNAEANYSITELECLAVVWSVKLFRPYLYGRAFTIITDHSALKWLMTRPNLAGRLHRWSLTLQEYEFEILYRPGATNVVADALSRAPAVVMAAVGYKRKRARAAGGTLLRGSTEAEEKTEAGELPTSSAVKDAEAFARLMTGRPAAALVSEWTPVALSTVESPTSTVVLSDDERRVKENAGIRANGPLTRAAKKRQEAVAAARRTERTLTGWRDDGVETTLSTTSRSGANGQDGSPITTPEWKMDEDAGPPTSTPEKGEHERARTRPGQQGSRRVTWATPLFGAARKDGVVQGITTPMSEAALGSTPPPQTVARDSERGVTKTPKPRDGVTVDKLGAGGVQLGAGRRPGDTETARLPLDIGASDELEGDDGVAPNAAETLQLTDADIVKAQRRSRLVQKLAAAGEYRGMPVEQSYGLVVVNTPSGKRVVLPPALWAVVFKEMHGSVWAGHLRGPHTYGRVAQLYWWPNLQREVKKWVRGCQECGSRKARPREVVPPLRSIHGGEVGDRWALDVAGPFPVADGGERYVVAALEYVTRYAVARCVTRHTAENVATFIMEDVVLRFGAFRELLTDGAPELTGEVIEKLVELLQARQVNPVPYRPQMVGLVERFHRSWKDCVATYMANEQQNDWNLWVKFAVYAYNSANHSTVALTPNELMMGRRLRAPNELLRNTQTSEAGELPNYHARLVAAMAKSHEYAEAARTKEQERQARYYNRRVRQARTFNPGDRVWIYNPPRGAKATKFVHRWMGPARIIEAAGYDNFLLQREDKSGAPEVVIAHVSFLASYHYPAPLLEQAAEDIDAQLEYEDQGGEDDGEAATAVVRTAAVRTSAATTRRTATAAMRRGGRKRKTMAGPGGVGDKGGRLVEVRRRRRRNRAGQYVLEYELRPSSDWRRAATGKWVSGAEYDRLFSSGRVVEDPAVEEGV